jgi:hypothetical protein
VSGQESGRIAGIEVKNALAWISLPAVLVFSNLAPHCGRKPIFAPIRVLFTKSLNLFGYLPRCPAALYMSNQLKSL